MKGFWETGGLRKEEEVQEREIFGRAEESRSRKGRNAAGSASALSDFRNAHFPAPQKTRETPLPDRRRSRLLFFASSPERLLLFGRSENRKGEFKNSENRKGEFKNSDRCKTLGIFDEIC